MLYHVNGGFGAKHAKGLLPYLPKYKYEAWYMVLGLDRSRVIKRDGITYRLYPARSLSKVFESYFGLIRSSELFRALSKLDINHTIVHFQGERGSILHDLLIKFPNLKVALQYHGYGQPQWLEWLEAMFITPFEKIYFRKIKHFFVPIRSRVSYLKNRLHIPSEKISFENIGIDFDLFKPGNRIKARKILNIPSKSFVITYVGPLIKSKGVDKIISAYQDLSKKHSHIFLLLIGGGKTDPLYSQAVKKADKVIGYIPNQSMPVYYQATNVLCFYGNQKMRKYAGPGIAPTEALACNINVISTNLHHFPDKINQEIGLIPTDQNDLLRKLDFLISKPEFRFKARNKIAPYVAYSQISKSIGKTYDKLLKSPF
jgi:glycosyltransferase involved in cell wall biosynthesis